MQKIEKVIWGIIGAGDVCEKKSAPALYSLPNSEVKMVMRRNAEKAADFAKRHKIPFWTTDLSELLQDSEINAIYIATPPCSHAELTNLAAKAGKAVYVEKPMARTYSESLTMIDACNEADVPLFVAYYRRSLPGFLKVKEILESGTIGVIRFVNIEMIQALEPEIISKNELNWRVIPEISGGGYFHDLASHQFDYLDYIFGPIKEATGITVNQSAIYLAEDIVTASFRFENGIIGSGVWCFNASESSKKDSLRIVGSMGELEFNTFGDPMIINVNLKNNESFQFQFSHKQPIQQPLVELIIDELRACGKSPSTGISGSRTSWVMDKIVRKI